MSAVDFDEYLRAAGMTPDYYRNRGRDARRRHRKRYRIYDRDNGCCVYCGEAVPPDNWHVDHRTPRSLGGSNRLDNLCVSCVHCNCSKGAQTAEAFADRMDG